MNDKPTIQEEVDLTNAIETVLKSTSKKKLIIAGPGTGKTTLFKKILELGESNPNKRIVLTFINNLKDDLEKDLSHLAKVYTLHSYCLGLLYENSDMRSNLSDSFRCCPGLASIIGQDWEFINEIESPKFIGEMRDLDETNNIPFYLARGEYYDAVDFDDTVYRVYSSLKSKIATPVNFDLILVDEYQDFNGLEAGLINELSKQNSILVAGDDDQALYSQLRNASWDHIRLLNNSEEYEIFELPFCMRCPEVIVDAVNDIILKAREEQKLKGRINKPYKYFSPVKGDDSKKYPKIINVKTSVQRNNANYIGRYIAQAIDKIDKDEILKAKNDGFPAVLLIVAQPYRDQVYNYLDSRNYPVFKRLETIERLNKEIGLSILEKEIESNLGWRIVMYLDNPPFLKELIKTTTEKDQDIFKFIPEEYKKIILNEIELFAKSKEELKEKETKLDENDEPSIRITSYEGAKGLSAQHVFIVGIHNGELPHDEYNISDLEICKFIVGLTRTRKECTLIHTRNFAGKWKDPSTFISWIDSERKENIEINAKYWKKS